jgi:protein-L-isoaspartate(D-aspartate) O-methyltransferase
MRSLRHSLRCVMLLCAAVIGLPAMSLSCKGDREADSVLTGPNRETERNRMVDQYVIPRGIQDPAVIAAMRHVPRHRFVPGAYSLFAYVDGPLPIGHNQTISQPSLVAEMTEQLKLKKTDKVLEVGTGSGYQAAILAELADRVLTIEIVEPLARQAEQTLAELGYKNVRVRVGDLRCHYRHGCARPRPATTARSIGRRRTTDSACWSRRPDSGAPSPDGGWL